MIKVSVIIPVYNVEKYLNQCLDSICVQTLKEIEIICINDGSTDNSWKILEKYAQNDSRFVIINKNNEGVSVARNTGISCAVGEFICFVDSDDYVDKNYLEKLYNAAVEYDCDIACCGFVRFNGIRKSVRKTISKIRVLKTIEEKIKIEKIPEHNYIWNKIYRRKSFLEHNLQFVQHRYFEDIEIVIKILNSLGDMVTVPDVNYYYRKNPTSIVHTQSPRKRKDYYWAISEFKKYVDENNIVLPENNLTEKRYIVRFFGIIFLKVYIKEFVTQIKLFGFIPLFSVSH